MSKESSVWFAMLVIFNELEKTKKKMEHSNNEEEISIMKDYENHLRDHLDNLEEVRRIIVKEEQNENSNKNKQVL